jgi:putative spermidine/putrescine transport system permease protein
MSKLRLSVCIYLLLALLPLVAGLVYALAYSLGLTGVLSEGFTTKHWQNVLADSALWSSLLLSMGVAISVLVAAAACALAAALYFRPWLSGRWQAFGYLPLTLPPIAAAFWAFQLLGQGGMMARLLGSSTPSDFPELINDQWHLGMVAALFMLTFPFMTLLFVAQVQASGLDSYLDVARTLGARAPQRLVRVAIPILLQRTRSVLILYGLMLVGAYEVPLLLGRQSPRMLSVLIAQKFRRFDLADIPEAYVLTCVYALIVLLTVQWLMRQRVL